MLFALLFALAVDQPVNGNVARPGFVPPVLKGVQQEGREQRFKGPIPFPDPAEEWARVTSKHFIFVSAAGEKRTRELAEHLETLTAALGRLSSRFNASPEPTRIYIFTKKREVQPYFDLLSNHSDTHVSGLFVAQKTSASILMLAGSSPRDDRTPYHELVHDLIENGSNPPLWLEEGLADYFSNAELRSGSIYAGASVPQHLEVLKRAGDLPLKRLFAVERESEMYNMPQGQSVFYAKSWATVDWLIRNGGKDGQKFYAFFRDVENGTPVEHALKNRYDMSVDQLQRAVGSYPIFNRTAYGMTIPVPETDKSVTSTPLDRAGILYELGKFLSGVEAITLDDMRPEAERHLRAALAANPKHAKSLGTLAAMRASAKKYDAAAKLFEEALAADPNDATMHLDYAEALLENQIGAVAEAEEATESDAPQFRKARLLAQRAAGLGGDAGRALGNIGTSYIAEKNADLAPGIAALEKAHALLPARTDYALHLLSMYQRTGQTAKADPLFTQLDNAKNAQVKFAARAIIVRGELSRANDLLKESKLEEAAAIMRSLAQSSPDAEAKADFERQAAEITRVANSNRQIEAYNAAIALVNKGRYSAARKALSELLASATDPGVILDARKLQTQLKGRKDLK